MLDSRILFALIPAIFAVFAIALAMLAMVDRRILAARWGAAAFALACLGVTLDAIRPPGHSWSLFYLHLAVVAAFAKALAARHRLSFPIIVGALLIGTALACGTLNFLGASLQVRQTTFNVGLFAALTALAVESWRWGHRRTADRFIIAIVSGLAASYALRVVYLHAFPVGDELSAQPNFFSIDVNLVFHFIMGLTGLSAGLLLIFVIGHDVIKAQANRLMLDPLTQLGNRHALAQAVAADNAGEWECCGAISMDLDKFKLVNDGYGHAIGDQLLAGVGAALNRVVGFGGRLFRIGGDEFLMLVEGKYCERIAAIAQEAHDAIAAVRLDGRGRPVRASASVGIYLRRDGQTIEDMLEKADRAMYAAKAAGRDQVMGFDDAPETRLTLVGGSDA
ncbi:GGDEF domain-containing protein [Sphingomonas sabuli]|uniref:diguanylate cyclase n=1 Tax=Sphingomonas sabuli TaxID=2764186 RepID=A0A7G9L567_9SPHN|nr:GGDEF domain-containing protein [Sphingomonas sabuli]QNM83766.1 GGDEF domain-containing protein [Sphingomonas sabuli]